MQRLAFTLLILTLIGIALSQNVPPFLTDVPKEKVEEFKMIMTASGGKTDKEIEDAVHAWIEKQDDSIKKKFAAHKDEMEKEVSTADAAHKAAIEKFSPEAKKADEELTKISNDSKLTADEKSEAMKKAVENLPPKVREEIEKAMQG